MSTDSGDAKSCAVAEPRARELTTDTETSTIPHREMVVVLRSAENLRGSRWFREQRVGHGAAGGAQAVGEDGAHLGELVVARELARARRDAARRWSRARRFRGPGIDDAHVAPSAARERAAPDAVRRVRRGVAARPRVERHAHELAPRRLEDGAIGEDPARALAAVSARPLDEVGEDEFVARARRIDDLLEAHGRVDARRARAVAHEVRVLELAELDGPPRRHRASA
eukprot:CAMPEP_0185703454 /NCGR_PEP_ID=MMETSP1164-20130828/14548_1 /TAXON_ID=1104430 /ORGANISM="Chrysoreinhardia sp, Strain CCMP2950" /LENGTH=226 /DNA_ID=CAMNT_0028370741 /DNA_START=410 /DNA_END=1087 /DNA_ORIENTATION=+